LRRSRDQHPEIYEEQTAGRVIPFLGAGVPLYTRDPRATPWMRRRKGKEEISYLPTAKELADYLADRTQIPDDEKGELTRMAQYFEAVRGPDPLRERLRDIFSHQQPQISRRSHGGTEWILSTPSAASAGDKSLSPNASGERYTPAGSSRRIESTAKWIDVST